jgi:hypothetical protein
VYIIKLLGKRYNNKKFNSFEEARKYVRRKGTEITGSYRDSYTDLGFQITTK